MGASTEVRIQYPPAYWLIIKPQHQAFTDLLKYFYLPDRMENESSAFLPLSLSIAKVCTTEVPTAAVSKTRPSNRVDRN